MGLAATIVGGFVLGWAMWTLGEYCLHRFAMHELNGKGIMSREHLRHHIGATWNFSYTHILSWIGMALVGFAVWMPLARTLVGPAFGWAVAVGWPFGYFFYEWVHAQAHLSAPRNAYGRWVRRNHFFHHYGNPRSNHGVSIGVWDRVFGTAEMTPLVRVPRRMTLPWMVDGSGDLLPEFADQYVIVGVPDPEGRLASLDKARAFASIAPAD